MACHLVFLVLGNAVIGFFVFSSGSRAPDEFELIRIHHPKSKFITPKANSSPPAGPDEFELIQINHQLIRIHHPIIRIHHHPLETEKLSFNVKVVVGPVSGSPPIRINSN